MSDAAPKPVVQRIWARMEGVITARVSGNPDAVKLIHDTIVRNDLSKTCYFVLNNGHESAILVGTEKPDPRLAPFLGTPEGFPTTQDGWWEVV